MIGMCMLSCKKDNSNYIDVVKYSFAPRNADCGWVYYDKTETTSHNFEMVAHTCSFDFSSISEAVEELQNAVQDDEGFRLLINIPHLFSQKYAFNFLIEPNNKTIE